MNFQLKLNNKKKKKKSKQPPKNVFGGMDDDDTEQVPTKRSEDTRSSVNRAIQQEQEAMRKRAEQSMKRAAEEQDGTSMYDYDGAYEESHAPEKKDSSTTDDPKKSRYIGDLLQAAKERNYDRDIAYERKMARDLEKEEAANEDLQGKERFVTASYKAKLQERKLWQEKQDARDQQEDAASRKGMAGFYGNFSKNVAMGASAPADSAGDPDHDEPSKKHTKPSFLDGFEQGEPSRDSSQQMISTEQTTKTELDPEQARLERRKLREEKVARARERYFQRQEEWKKDQSATTR